MKTKGKTDRLGIDVPLVDYHLVRGAVLRDLQKRCREAEYAAALRSRIIARLLKQQLRKESPWSLLKMP